MEHGPDDWMTAAACAEGPRPTVTFADLPPQHQGELVRLAIVAALSAAYFVTLVVAAPLASRSLAARSELPRALPARSPALAPQLLRAAVETASERRPATRPRPAVALASFREPVGDPPATSSSPRRNPFSRFFRGVLRTVVSTSAD